MRVSIQADGEKSAASRSQPSNLEHTGSSLRKSTSYLSQVTTLAAGTDDESISVGSSTDQSSAESDDGEPGFEEDELELISIWTWQTIGLPVSGFLLAFLNAIASGVVYGFFLGYMGLDSYVMASVAALMKLPEVFLFPLGMINDCFPIFGYNRKPYLLACWLISGGALLVMSLRHMPAPYYCQYPDGSYDWYSPPCNPDIHTHKNWYIFPLFVLIAGLQIGSTAGEGLILQYSRCEPAERRGHIKAEMTMVCTAGGLTSSLVIGFLLNGKAYLGTFDWGLSFSGLMAVCLVMVIIVIPVSWFCVHEPQKTTHPALRGHAKSSWKLVCTRSPGVPPWSSSTFQQSRRFDRADSKALPRCPSPETLQPQTHEKDCGAKLKLALVVVTIVNVDGGIYRVIRGHFGSRVTPENFKGGSQRQVGCCMDLVVVSESLESGFAFGGPLEVQGGSGCVWQLASLCFCVWVFGLCCGCLCRRPSGGREAPATWSPPTQPGPSARWERIARRAINFVRSRRRLSLAFANLGNYSLRNAPESKPNLRRRVARRASTPGPILHEGPALHHGSDGDGADRHHGPGRSLHVGRRDRVLGAVPQGIRPESENSLSCLGRHGTQWLRPYRSLGRWTPRETLGPSVTSPWWSRPGLNQPGGWRC